MTLKKIILLVACVLFLGCTYEHQKGSSQETGLGGNDFSCTPIDFAQVQAEIFGVAGSSGKCISCHNSGGNFMPLESYAQIKPRLSQIADAVRAGRMPKNSPLPDLSKQLLFAWIDQGAPETIDASLPVVGCEGGTGTNPPPLEIKPNYESLKATIFSSRCISCHDSSGFVTDYDFTSYESMTSYKKLFKTPTTGGDNRFIHALVTGEMPEKSTPLPQEQIDVIRLWIELGLPEFEGAPGIDLGNPPSPVPGDGTVSNPPKEDCIDYAFIKAQVFEQRCVGCHGTKGGVNLETYSNVKSHLSMIEKMVSTDQMPPKKPLAADLKKNLLAWIKNGAPEAMPSGSNCSAPAIEPLKPLEATYNSIREHFLEAKCIVCHSGPIVTAAKKGGDDFGQDQKIPDFSTYQVMVSQTGLFDFKKPHKSELMEVIYDGEMPPKNSSAKPLTSQETQVLLEWIKKGLPEG